MSATKLPIRFATVEEYDYFCQWNHIEREDSKLDCLLMYADDYVYKQVLKRNKRDYLRKWVENWSGAIKEEQNRQKHRNAYQRKCAEKEETEQVERFDQFMRTMKREMEEKEQLRAELGRNKRKQHIQMHIDNFIYREEDPDMLRQVSDPALMMWSQPRHPMFANRSRKLKELGPVQPVELIAEETCMLRDGSVNMRASTPKSRASSRANSPGSSCAPSALLPRLARDSSYYSRSCPGSAAVMHSRPCSSAAIVIHTQPSSAAATHSRPSGAAGVQSRPGTADSATSAATARGTGIIVATETIEKDATSATCSLQSQRCTMLANTGSTTQQPSARNRIIIALSSSLCGCYLHGPQPDPFDHDRGPSSMSFATNAKLMEYIKANHKEEYIRMLKRLERARVRNKY